MSRLELRTASDETSPESKSRPLSRSSSYGALRGVGSSALGNNIPDTKDLHILRGSIRIASTKTLLCSVFQEENIDHYQPLNTLIKLINGRIMLGAEKAAEDKEGVAVYSPLNEVDSRRDSCCSVEESRFLIDEAHFGLHIPQRPQNSRSSNRAALLPILFVEGHHSVASSKVKGLETEDIKTIRDLLVSFEPKDLARHGEGQDSVQAQSGPKYFIHDIRKRDGIALLLNEDKSSYTFYGDRCSTRRISTDECRISANGKSEGYVVFRIRHNCVVLFKSVHDDTPVLFREHGMYVMPESEVADLTIYDLNNPDYLGDDDLKVLHLNNDERAFYYSKDLLQRRYLDIKEGGIQLSREEVMPQTSGAGIHLIYDANHEWNFYRDKQTGKPIVNAVDDLVMELKLDNYKQASVNVPDNMTYYYIESYGGCQVILLDAKHAVPSLDNIHQLEKDFRMRTNMAYIRHSDAIYYVHFRLNRCQKLPNLNVEMIQEFDALINPPRYQGRDITDQELDRMEELFKYPSNTIQKMSVIRFLRGKIEKDLFYDPHLMSVILPPRCCTGTDPVVRFGEYLLIEIPVGMVAITKLKGQAILITAENHHQGEFRVYNANAVLISIRSEDFVGMYPVSHPQIQFKISTATRDKKPYTVVGAIDYFIADPLTAIIPFQTIVEGTPSEQVKQVIGKLSEFVKRTVTTAFRDYIEMNHLNEIESSLRGVIPVTFPAGHPNSTEKTLVIADHSLISGVDMKENLKQQVEALCRKRGLRTGHLNFQAGSSQENTKRLLQRAMELDDSKHKSVMAQEEMKASKFKADAEAYKAQSKADIVASTKDGDAARYAQITENSGADGISSHTAANLALGITTTSSAGLFSDRDRDREQSRAGTGDVVVKITTASHN